MSKLLGRAGLLALAALFASGAAFGAAYDPGHWNMPEGVTAISHEVYGLHMTIFWVCVVIAVVVFGTMFYSVFAHRKSKHPKPADFHESTLVEIVWTVIPFLILIAMAIPAAGALIKLEDVKGAELSVKVTGFQWKWNYEYMGQGVSFFSTLHADSNKARQLQSGIAPTSVPNYLLEVDNRLVLPTQRKIRFVITANDVIHAWWVPDFAVKKDAIPGFVNEIWTKIDTPGVYRGVCAELCGRDHGFMPIVVEAVEPAQFDAWLADRKAGKETALGHGPALQVASAAEASSATAGSTSAAAPAATEVAAAAPAPAAAEAPKPAGGAVDGQKVYVAQCAACHQPSGQGLPPSFPSLVGSKVVNGPAEAHILQVLKGKNLMPAFGQLPDADIAAAINYERSSWGNKGAAVTAAQVAAARK